MCSRGCCCAAVGRTSKGCDAVSITIPKNYRADTFDVTVTAEYGPCFGRDRDLRALAGASPEGGPESRGVFGKLVLRVELPAAAEHRNETGVSEAKPGTTDGPTTEAAAQANTEAVHDASEQGDAPAGGQGVLEAGALHCFNAGDEDGPFTCTSDGMRYDAEKGDVECPRSGCTEALCCTKEEVLTQQHAATSAVSTAPAPTAAVLVPLLAIAVHWRGSAAFTVATMLLLLSESASAHNWIDNPKSRAGGGQWARMIYHWCWCAFRRRCDYGGERPHRLPLPPPPPVGWSPLMGVHAMGIVPLPSVAEAHSHICMYCKLRQLGPFNCRWWPAPCLCGPQELPVW